MEGWLRASVLPLLIVYVGAVALSATFLHVSSQREARMAAAAAIEHLADRIALQIEGELARRRDATRDALILIADQARRRAALALQQTARVALIEQSGEFRRPPAASENVIHASRDIGGGRFRLRVEQDVDVALASWRAHARGYGSLLVGATGLVVCFALFARWQGRRADAAEDTCERFYDRVDAALDSGRCGLWDWDVAAGEIHWSRSMFEMLGLQPQPAPITFADLAARVHPEDLPLADLSAAVASAQAQPVDHEFRVRHANGAWVWLRARARAIRDAADGSLRLTGIAIDVTERKRIMSELERADRRLRDAINQISEAFVLWDADNRLVLCNSKFRELNGLSAADAKPGRSYKEVMAHAQPPLVRLEQELEVNEDESARRIETALADGRWLQINERRTSDGGFVSVGTEITAVKRQQDQLIDSERRLTMMIADLKRSRQALEAQAQQFAELAERYLEQKSEAESANRAKLKFLSNMSHELRTPLNAIIGFSELMMSGVFGQLNPRHAEYCKHIGDSGVFLLRFVEDILEMSSIESGRRVLMRAPTSVNESIQEAMLRAQADAAAKKISLSSERLDGASFCVDGLAIQQTLSHLLQNAIKFTPEGGQVALRARRTDKDILLFVEDSGIGMTREALAQLGRPFEQIENQFSKAYKGSGLGLAIARSLVEMHGGTLRIRSAPGHGTIVRVCLPIEPPPMGGWAAGEAI